MEQTLGGEAFLLKRLLGRESTQRRSLAQIPTKPFSSEAFFLLRLAGREGFVEKLNEKHTAEEGCLLAVVGLLLRCLWTGC